MNVLVVGGAGYIGSHVARALLDGFAADRPFFLFLHYWDVHYDYIPPPPYDRMFDPDYEGTIDARNFERGEAIHRHMDCYDFLRGDEPYKVNWHAEPYAVMEFRVAADRLRARLVHRAWQSVTLTKRWLRRGKVSSEERDLLAGIFDSGS